MDAVGQAMAEEKEEFSIRKDEEKNLNLLLRQLFPITRSLMGEGNRQTLDIIKDFLPLEIVEYPSGTKVFDWVIPDEWKIKDAFIANQEGHRIVDFRANNLHVVGYSAPIDATLSFDELRPHLNVLPDMENGIPYRTSYYKRDWGFCVTPAQYKTLSEIDDVFTVKIDSSFNPNGSMTVAEIFVPGKSREEYFVSTYFCHPSMANDNLSGLLLTAFLARDMLRHRQPEKSWRFIFVPETIGALAYLRHNQDVMEHTVGGLVATTCGGPGPLGYKETFLGDHHIDRAIDLAFRDRGIKPIRYRFVPDGSDERQYSSPGFRFPVASITKDKYYEYPEYHTSLDNLDFVNGAQITESLEIYRDVVGILDSNIVPVSVVQHGEPQLGRRGLYPSTGGAINQPSAKVPVEDEAPDIDAMSWVCFMADGSHDLISIAERSELHFSRILNATRLLDKAGVVQVGED